MNRITSDAERIMFNKIKDDPEALAIVDDIRFHILAGEKIYTARERNGISPEELAEKMRISVEELDIIEQGGYEGDYLKILYTAAEVMNCRIAFDVNLIHRELEHA